MKLVKKTVIPTPRDVYNLHIRDHHNYIVEGAVVANCHSAKADQLKELLTGPMANIPIRWGLTGTVPKDPSESYSLFASIGNVASTLSASELMDKGVLSNLHISIQQLMDHRDFKTYQDEYQYLVEDQVRIEYLAEYIRDIAKSGNTLVLMDRIHTGQELQRLLPESVFVSGSMKVKDRKKIYDEINSRDNSITLASYGVAAVGISITRIFNLVLIEPGKSFVRVIQSIGRGIRKGFDKDFVNVYDICSTCKFSSRQLTERKKYYREANYPAKVEKVDYRKGK